MHSRKLFSALLLAAALYLTSCSGRKIHYSFQRSANGDRLLPPAIKPGPDRSQPIIRFRSARRTRPAFCTFSNSLLDLRWNGRAAETHLKSDLAMEAKVESQDPRLDDSVSLDLLQQFHDFQIALSLMEEQGCFSSGESAALARRVIESLPLSTHTAFSLQYGSFGQLGYVDLTAAIHLRVVSPILDTGIEEMQKQPDLIGSKTEYYDVFPHPSGSGFQLKFEKAELNFVDETSSSEPLQRLFDFPPSPAYYRLLFLTRGRIYNYNSAVLAAPSRQLLEAKTNLIQEHPKLCQPHARDFACIPIPAKTAAIPEMKILVNRKPVFIHLAGTVRDAILKAGTKQPEQIPPHLKINRPYRNRKIPITFDRSKADILHLVLIGGEEIQW